MEQGITISITGGHHSGKTNVAAIIAKALSDAGVDDLKVVSQDHDFAVRAMSFNPQKAQEVLKDTPVMIEDLNGHSVPPTGTENWANLMTYAITPQRPVVFEPYELEISESEA